MPAGQEPTVGDLELRSEGDVLFVRPIGALSMEQAHHIVQNAKRVKAEHRHYFLLVDLKRAGLLSAQVRRFLAEFGAESPAVAVALYHVSPLVRGFNALLFGAVRLLGRQSLNVMQFSTEKEARDWMGAERKRLIPSAP